MSNNEKYQIKKLSHGEMIEELSNVSPLKMSKKLLEYELYDQQDSIEILNQIYEDFENNQNIVDELVNPMLLNVCDGLIKHPKLEGTFRKTNITPSRLVNEVNNFKYDDDTFSKFNDDFYLRQGEKSHYGTWQRKEFYDTKPREQTEQENGIYRQSSKESAEVKDAITGETLHMRKIDADGDSTKVANMDHVNPINKVRDDFKNNPYIFRDDIQKLVALPQNEAYINASLNSSKGDMSWSEYIEKFPDALTPKEQKKALKLEQKANEAQNEEATKLVVKNIGLDALGDVIIMTLKPIWFEFKEMITNGVVYGFSHLTNDKFEAFIFRLKRVYAYIKEKILEVLGANLKKVIENFVGVIISVSIDIFKGIFKQFMQILSNGFMALKEAFKVILKDKDEQGNIISPSQKADAITKIIATSIIPILTFSFEQSFSKIPILGDVATIIVTGLLSTLVVWALNEIDLFSVKAEKRARRVKEIFEFRINTIKENTDIFEKASLEILAKQKLQFKKIADTMSQAIDKNLPVNDAVNQMADFMGIDLKVKSTDDFLQLLNSNQKLVI